MSTSLPALAPLSPIDAQNRSALEDALQQYTTAKQHGIPGMDAKIAATQQALGSYGASYQPSQVTPTTNTPAQSSSTLGNIFGGLKDGVNGFLHPLGGSDGTGSILYSSRLIMLILGLLLIGAGLFSFKTTQTVIETGTKAAKKGAELAAS